jgi:hypothetical protein
MKKLISVFIFLIGSFAGNSQIFGEYAKVYGGNILFYPYSDSSSIFRLDVFRGPPSYNSGALSGLVRFKGDNTYEFYEKDDSYMNCHLIMKLNADTLSIEVKDEKHECGFGYGVMPDGNFYLKDTTIPQFYYNGEGSKFYFKDMKFSE